MLALVTGGGGFIGSNLVERLLERGHDVKVLDNFSTGSRRNLAPFEGALELIEGDLRSYERVSHAVRDCEVVFHEGALPSVPRSVQDPITSNEVNVDGTLNVLLAGARRRGTTRGVRVVVVDLRRPSGSARASRPCARRRSRPTRSRSWPPRVLWRRSKRLRPRDGRAALLQRLRTAPGPDLALRGGDPAVHHRRARGGAAAHDLRRRRAVARLHATSTNVVEANLLAADLAAVAGGVLNVATGESHSLNEMVATLEPSWSATRSSALRSSAHGRRTRFARRHRAFARPARLRTPGIGFEDGLRETIATYGEPVSGDVASALLTR